MIKCIYNFLADSILSVPICYIRKDLFEKDEMKFKILGRTVVMMFLIAIFMLFLLGCEKDIIENPDYLLADSLYIESGSGGESELVFAFSDIDPSFPDVNVLIVQSDNYSDTVASFKASTHYNYFVVKGLEPETTDIVIYGDGYCPIKENYYFIFSKNEIIIDLLRRPEPLEYQPGRVTIVFKNFDIDSTSAVSILDEFELELRRIIRITRAFYLCNTSEEYAYDIYSLIELLMLDKRIYWAEPDEIYISTIHKF